MTINIIQADYSNARHGSDIQSLLDLYARDPMGGGVPLQEKVKRSLVKRLARLPYAFSLLAYDQETALGLANCFESFSTFKAQPLINIHDLMVVESHRGHGISQLLLQRIEQQARDRGCCKVTLEVLSENTAARSAYRKFGFAAYQLKPQAGIAEFWQKELVDC